MKKQPYIFLLGGYDLEMQEIAKLLKANDQELIDRGLSWGAVLSAYNDDLVAPKYKGQTFVGIELTEDINTPENYLRIDHHNDLTHLPSAIRQVADLLDIQLNRWQELVAANDSGFIPAMEKLGASREEIASVRAADRRAQGVTDEDEILAQESINKHSRIQNGVTVIFSLPPLFTPITDRMYGRTDRLLCYNDRKLTYYGPGIRQLAKEFDDLIQKKAAYQGGGESGYFGLSEDHVEGPIESWVDRIIEILKG